MDSSYIFLNSVWSDYIVIKMFAKYKLKLIAYLTEKKCVLMYKLTPLPPSRKKAPEEHRVHSVHRQSQLYIIMHLQLECSKSGPWAKCSPG